MNPHTFLHTLAERPELFDELSTAGIDVTTPKASQRMSRVTVTKNANMNNGLIRLLILLTYVITPEELATQLRRFKLTSRKRVALKTLLETLDFDRASTVVARYFGSNKSPHPDLFLAYDLLVGPSRFSLYALIIAKCVAIRPTLAQVDELLFPSYLQQRICRFVQVNIEPNLRGIVCLDWYNKLHWSLWQQTPTGWDVVAHPKQHPQVSTLLFQVKFFAALNPPPEATTLLKNELLIEQIRHFNASTNS